MTIKWQTNKWMNKIEKCKIDTTNAKITNEAKDI